MPERVLLDSFGADMSDQAGHLLRFFNERGYQPILLSRTDLVPPEVYYLEERACERLGSLHSFISDKAEALPLQIADVPDFENVTIGSHAAQIELSFFKRILQVFGLGSAELKAKVTGDMGTAFRFRGVTLKSISVATIEQALAQGLKTDALSPEDVADGRIHIAYEYLYAKRMQLLRGDGRDIQFGLSSDLAEVARLQAGASSSVSEKNSEEYDKSTNPIAIAFKVGQLINRGSQLRLRTRINKSGAFGIDPRSSPRTPYLYKENTVLSIK
jgi:hypothetical protein